MLEQEPSRTALAAAAHRAAHQLLEQGRIFADPLALTILGQDAETIAAEARANPSRLRMRIFVAARSHFAEAALKLGVEARGVTQLVVLGAGLDAFAYRNPFASRLKVFEIDHPATQAWKQRRLREAGIAQPDWLAFAPVDFERDRLLEGLAAAGFEPARRTFFMWLGVVPYLTEDAVLATLAAIGGIEGGVEVAFDYSDPPHTLALAAQALYRERAARVAALGEPWLSHFEPAALHAKLRAFGFDRIDDLGPRAFAARYWPGASASPPEHGGHLIHAITANSERV